VGEYGPVKKWRIFVIFCISFGIFLTLALAYYGYSTYSALTALSEDRLRKNFDHALTLDLGRCTATSRSISGVSRQDVAACMRDNSTVLAQLVKSNDPKDYFYSFRANCRSGNFSALVEVNYFRDLSADCAFEATAAGDPDLRSDSFLISSLAPELDPVTAALFDLFYVADP